jgi:hypothetical protein
MPCPSAYAGNPGAGRRPRAGGRRASDRRCRSCHAFCVYDEVESYERAIQEPGADLRSAGRTGGGARAWVRVRSEHVVSGGAGAGARFHGSGVRSREVPAIGSAGLEQGAVFQPGMGPRPPQALRERHHPRRTANSARLSQPTPERGRRYRSAGRHAVIKRSSCRRPPSAVPATTANQPYIYASPRLG